MKNEGARFEYARSLTAAERRAVPGDKGELTFGKLAVVITFCLRADACGFYIDQVDRFFVLPDGT